MKIAFSSYGKSMHDELNPRLGRCEYFIIYDTESGSVDSLDNTGRLATGAAGIATARLLNDQGIEVIITGNVGPNAFTALEAAGIKVYIGASGKVGDVLLNYQKGELTEANGPSVGPNGR
ncbi:NifB/NifX family molybdenum-iron cluster-binding protein [Desulfotomaculum defluvii]